MAKAFRKDFSDTTALPSWSKTCFVPEKGTFIIAFTGSNTIGASPAAAVHSPLFNCTPVLGL